MIKRINSQKYYQRKHENYKSFCNRDKLLNLLIVFLILHIHKDLLENNYK